MNSRAIQKLDLTRLKNIACEFMCMWGGEGKAKDDIMAQTTE